MEIRITEIAAQKIEENIRGKKGFLKLKYDTEDCGCVMCGVIDLWLVDTLSKDDQEIETNKGSIYIEKSKEVFFDEKLTIDFSESINYFQLKSPGQYINPRMNFYDKTRSYAE